MSSLEFWLRLVDLGGTAVLAFALILVMRQMIRHSAARDERIVTALENHLSEISRNQARTAAALDLIITRLLKVIVR